MIRHLIFPIDKDDSLWGGKTKTDQVFKSKVALKRHTSAKHGSTSDTKEFACAECDKVFSAQRSLLRHEKEKHMKYKVNLNFVQFGEELQAQCDICEKRFRRKENMDVHEYLVHEKGVIEILEVQRCLFCFKTCTTSSNCKRHQNNLV